MSKYIVFIFLAGLLSCTGEKGVDRAFLKPEHLRCEYLEDPQVVDVRKPRLDWINVADGEIRGEVQTAWQVRVASGPEKLSKPDLWDSGKQDSGESSRIVYGGKALESRQECWWQVRTWNRAGEVSRWSDPAFWRMGLLDAGDWKASWIGAPWEGEAPVKRPGWGKQATDTLPPAPMFRKEFQVEQELEKAVVFVTGLGYFELYLNGRKVGEDVLVPNQTNYGKRPDLEKALISIPDHFTGYKVMYLAYDVKELLVQGPNALGSILGNGFYNPGSFWAEGYGTTRFLCQLHLSYKDGSEEVIASNSDWKASGSPLLKNMIYWGETYDARREQPGWKEAGFDDAAWEAARIAEAPEGRLVAHAAMPDRVMRRLEPSSIEKLGEGHYRVDFGEEITGWVRLKGIDGSAGHRVEIIPNANLASGECRYICKGDGPANHAPRFNWMVFSGVEIRNWPGELRADHLVAEFVHTHIEEGADFETSNGLFNQINEIWRRSQMGNMHGGIASDCPHRERSAYTGDGQVACMTVIHNYDARSFYQKWIGDMREAQNPEDGYVPNGAPWQPTCGGGPAWGSAICVMPWEFYTQYGSKDMLADNYDAMKGYVRYMLSWTGEDGIMFSQRTGREGQVVKWFNLGEWVPPGKMIPQEMAHTFYLWYCAHLTSRTAGVLGKDREAAKYAELAEKTRDAFRKRFYDSSAGSYGAGGGNILALKMGIPDKEQYERVVAALAADIRRADGHLDTGILGTRFFFEVLADCGLQQQAYEAMNKRTEPSFGRWIELGSTTTREQWGEGGSYNHPMFGGGLTWFYRNLAGLQIDYSQADSLRFTFRPQPVVDLDYVKYHRQTPYGEAGIHWRQSAESFEMDVLVPVGCTAMVHVPTEEASLVMEGKGAATEANGLAFLAMNEGYAVFEVGSGAYKFWVKSGD